MNTKVQFRREEIIKRVIKTFEKKGTDIDIKQLKQKICAQYGCAWRTAKEYIDTALWKFKHASR